MSKNSALLWDRVTRHAHAVVSGQRVAGELHKLACRRHLQDLDRQNSADFPYVWRPEAADEVLQYAETLTVAEGDEPRPVKLLEEQAFDIGCTFGWYRTANNKRRFRRRYKSMGRQNGKTFENGIMGKLTVDMLDAEVRYAVGDGSPYFSLYAGMGEEIGAQLTVADAETGVLAEAVYNSFDAETEEEQLAVIDLLVTDTDEQVELPDGDWTELKTEEEIKEAAQAVHDAVFANAAA